MNTNREIHALDQAVVLTMHKLDEMFAHRVEGWKRAQRGLSIKICNSRNEGDVFLDVCPVGAAEDDYVSLRLMKFGGIWECVEGQFPGSHSAEELRHILFSFERIPNKMTGKNSPDILPGILSREHTYSCSSY